jgi:uncharacterized protein DUF6796
MAIEAHDRRCLRLAGIAGIIGAICWTIGDAAIVGENAQPENYPLLLIRYADRIDFGGLFAMLPASEPRLAFGALIADLAIPLYLIGSWHLFQAARPAGPLMSWAIFALLVCGNAYSPLGHAAFYFVGMLYKTIPAVPEAAHPALLDLGNRFHQVLLIAWVAAVGCLALALLLLGLAIAFGRTLYPRWAALVLNPVTLVLVGMAVPYLTPQPLRTWLAGAAFNIGWVVAYGLSTALLWRAKPTPSAQRVPA